MTFPDDFDEGPPTVEAPIPEELLDPADTDEQERNAWWAAGREVGRAEGRHEALEALAEALVDVGVSGAEAAAIVERVRTRAEGA